MGFRYGCPDWDLTWDFGRDATNKDLSLILTEMQPIEI